VNQAFEMMRHFAENVPEYLRHSVEYWNASQEYLLKNGMSQRALNASLVWLSLCALALFVTLVLSFRLRFGYKLLMFWYVYDFFVHVVLEGSFVYFSLALKTTIEDSTSENIFVSIWKEYGLADIRWARADPTVVSLELLTVSICSFLCILIISALHGETNPNKKELKAFRCAMEIILATMELYGGWMTFCPEWLIGSPSLSTKNPIHLWFYLVFQNMTWVVIPLLIVFRAIGDLKAIARSNEPLSNDSGRPKTKLE